MPEKSNAELYNEMARSFNKLTSTVERECKLKDKSGNIYIQRSYDELLEKMEALLAPLGLKFTK